MFGFGAFGYGVRHYFRGTGRRESAESYDIAVVN